MRDLKAKLRDMTANKSGALSHKAPPPTNCLVKESAYDLMSFCLPKSAYGALFGVDGDVDIEKALYLDTETTGLSGGAGTVAFLIGVGRQEGEKFTLYQFFLRDYAEEPFQLEAVEKLLNEASCLITFNGKSFDMPLILSRMLMQGKKFVLNKPHIDLLHAARRFFKLRMDSMALKNLEKEILSFDRGEDVESAKIPDMYFSYLKNGNFAPMENILRHNAWDIVSMHRLLAKMAEIYENPADARDAYMIGRAHVKARDFQAGIRYFHIADMKGLQERARISLAEAYRKLNKVDTYISINRQMIHDDMGEHVPAESLAKVFEHKKHDYASALAMTDIAIGRAAMRDKEEKDCLPSLLKRKKRLLKKIERQEAQSIARGAYINCHIGGTIKKDS